MMLSVATFNIWALPLHIADSVSERVEAIVLDVLG